ncbi:hypothetical protein BJX68DRAFT_268704 [Aspergillus pseudodeflectus]|uniref:Uncharacterized protein n=1 Tax=Aspergillus pseudodeflectus TaxID=176178 RepID=A0ABR4K387_9EURO
MATKTVFPAFPSPGADDIAGQVVTLDHWSAKVWSRTPDLLHSPEECDTSPHPPDMTALIRAKNEGFIGFVYLDQGDQHIFEGEQVCRYIISSMSSVPSNVDLPGDVPCVQTQPALQLVLQASSHDLMQKNQHSRSRTLGDALGRTRAQT